MTTAFLGLGPYQWLALIVFFTTLFVLFDALVGHYRHRFAYRLQYAPLITGGALIVTAVAAIALPDSPAVVRMLRTMGWIAGATGLIGFGYHLYYGIVTKPGGLSWWLHYLMYGAPLLAPFALTAMGILAVVASAGLSGDRTVFGFPIASVLVVFVVVALLGSILQAAILHYRGAFNNPAMYLPLSIPVATALVGLWVAAARSPTSLVAFAGLLWLTLIIGFIGFGMHLRGLDRQMGGLYVPVFNVMQGPPQGAPGLFAALAGIGLIVVYLL